MVDPSVNAVLNEGDVTQLRAVCERLKKKLNPPLPGLYSKRYVFDFEKNDCNGESVKLPKTKLRITADEESVFFTGADRGFENFVKTIETDTVGLMKGFCSQLSGTIGIPVVNRHVEYTGQPVFLKSIYSVAQEVNCKGVKAPVDCFRIDYSEATTSEKYEVTKRVYIGFLQSEMAGLEAFREEILYTKCNDDSNKENTKTKAVLKEIIKP